MDELPLGQPAAARVAAHAHDNAAQATTAAVTKPAHAVDDEAAAGRQARTLSTNGSLSTNNERCILSILLLLLPSRAPQSRPGVGGGGGYTTNAVTLTAWALALWWYDGTVHLEQLLPS